MAEENTINTQAHINYEGLVAFREEFEAARKVVTDAIESKVDTLIGTDASKSARAIAIEVLTEKLIPENAKEALDTLAEIAAWIQNHPDDVATMNAATAKLNGIVAGIGGDEDTYKTITSYVTAQINAVGIGDYYNKTQVDTELGKKVDKVDNKSLVDDTEIARLGGMSTGANKTEISASYTEGLKVGTISIDGVGTDIFVPVVPVATIRAMFHTEEE